jgi:hypothetical protein
LSEAACRLSRRRLRCSRKRPVRPSGCRSLRLGAANSGPDGERLVSVSVGSGLPPGRGDIPICEGVSRGAVSRAAPVAAGARVPGFPNGSSPTGPRPCGAAPPRASRLSPETRWAPRSTQAPRRNARRAWP